MNQQVRDRLYHFLQEYKKRSIVLPTLQNIFDTTVDYSRFAHAVQQLEAEGVLTPVKAQGYNRKDPPLAYKYHIGRTAMHQDFYLELKRVRLRLHPAIQLDYYYKSGPKRWEQDLPWLEKLDTYLKKHGLPQDEVPAPERSYHLMGDEKWYDEAGGKEFLEQVGLGNERLAIISAPEPLAWAFQPDLMANKERTQHLHLIVENKTPFHALLAIFTQQEQFTTLIYGRGKAVVSGLPLFYRQAGLALQQRHHFLYFGDLDFEGIGIWHSLRQRVAVQLALPFYQDLLTKPYSPGKDNHRPNEEALSQFLLPFTPPEQERIERMLAQGCYLPQEALSSEEIKRIGRHYPWTND